MKFMTLATATALAGLAVALAAGASPAKADFIFGSLTPTPACGALSGPGSVCANDETFTSGGQTVTAHGSTDGPLNAGNANLTLKPMPPNTLAESGLGVQNLNGQPSCTNSDCEIAPSQSVSVTASTSIIKDALIGSVQPGETFNFFVQNTLGVFTLLASNVTVSGGTCNSGMMGFSSPGTDQCRWDAPPGQSRFGVAVVAVTGDELLTSVSTVPGPIVGAGLPGLIAACGGLLALARRRRKFVA